MVVWGVPVASKLRCIKPCALNRVPSDALAVTLKVPVNVAFCKFHASPSHAAKCPSYVTPGGADRREASLLGERRPVRAVRQLGGVKDEVALAEGYDGGNRWIRARDYICEGIAQVVHVHRAPGSRTVSVRRRVTGRALLSGDGQREHDEEGSRGDGYKQLSHDPPWVRNSHTAPTRVWSLSSRNGRVKLRSLQDCASD